ncbi:toll/interleukin-1 receptor domain-containing protein [Exiguobacterium sp. s142]|uniref:toll/interleukin-1 receptor domain-containing protein n=1 Tax=Exiguobacterium sp. s142 TaxID=2751222 RepID=UPI001BEA0D9E|nr:toll/interleukin-1 receptor domain-containing protein [Exiguobacterium sp. s142]
MSDLLDDQSKSEVLFISHSSADVAYVKELVDFLSFLKIPIVCSSLPGHHIKNDRDIYDYLAGKMKKRGRVIFLLSENYYKSAACLNEMGACWILEKDYSIILTPNFDFNNIDGAINPRQMSFKLDNRERLLELFNSLQSEFIVPDFSFPETIKISEFLDTSLEKINQLSFSEKRRLNDPEVRIEGIKGDANNVILKVRIINSTPRKIIINSIRVHLVDKDENSLFHETKDEPIKLHSEENRVFNLSIPSKESEYNRYFRKIEEIDILHDTDW